MWIDRLGVFPLGWDWKVWGVYVGLPSDAGVLVRILLSSGSFFFLMHPLSFWNNEMAFFFDLEMNQINVVSFRFRPLSSLNVCGDFVSMKSSTLVGLGWIPSLVA